MVFRRGRVKNHRILDTPDFGPRRRCKTSIFILSLCFYTFLDGFYTFPCVFYTFAPKLLEKYKKNTRKNMKKNNGFQRTSCSQSMDFGHPRFLTTLEDAKPHFYTFPKDFILFRKVLYFYISFVYFWGVPGRKSIKN